MPSAPSYQPPTRREGAPPRELKPVVVLLLANLGLSILLTILVLINRHDVVNYVVDHKHIADPQRRAQLRTGYESGIWGRVLGNLIVSVFYTWLVRALLRGKRWAYRRVLVISILGILGLIVIQFTPYPPWMRVEEVVQALILAALLYVVTRPAVKAWCTIPGGRFSR